MGKKQKKQSKPNVIYEAFFSGIPYESTEDDLKQFLGSEDGIVSIKMPRYQDSQKCRGYAHIRFDDQQAYKNALQKDKKYLKQRYITVQPAKGEKQVQAPSIPVGCKTLFVKGLPYQIKQQELKKQFSSCGGIIDVRMVRNSVNRKFKGFAYIQYKQASSLQKAIKKYHNRLFQQRRLICDASTTSAKGGYKKRNMPEQDQNKNQDRQEDQ